MATQEQPQPVAMLNVTSPDGELWGRLALYERDLSPRPTSAVGMVDAIASQLPQPQRDVATGATSGEVVP